MELRPYQTQAVEASLAALQQHKSALVVQPTGTGKTVLFSHVAQRWSRGRVMVLAHREELIRQAAEKLHAITGIDPDIEMADQRADINPYYRSKYVVSSVQTLIAGGESPRMRRFSPGDFGLLIPDEAHRTPAPTYRRIFDYFRQGNPDIRILGVTATPDRLDGIGLGFLFETVAYEYYIVDAVRDAWLVRPHTCPVDVHGLDYSGVSVSGGDLAQDDVAQAQAPFLEGITDSMVREAGSLRTLVFATPGYATENGQRYHVCRQMEAFIEKRRPGQVRRVSQDTPRDERREIVADFAAGRFQFLLNVAVFTEGFDDPGIQCIAMCRPTTSRALYEQMLGRGTRPLPGVVDGVDAASGRRHAIEGSGKPRLLVLDFFGNAGKHKLVHCADVLGGRLPDDIRKRASEKAAESGGDVLGLLDAAIAEREAAKQRERDRLAARIAAARYTVREVDPFAALEVDEPEAKFWDVNTEPTWEMRNALLNRYGVPKDVVDGLTLRQAGAMVKDLRERKDRGWLGYQLAQKAAAMDLPTRVTVGELLNMMKEAGVLK